MIKHGRLKEAGVYSKSMCFIKQVLYQMDFGKLTQNMTIIDKKKTKNFSIFQNEMTRELIKKKKKYHYLKTTI